MEPLIVDVVSPLVDTIEAPVIPVLSSSVVLISTVDPLMVVVVSSTVEVTFFAVICVESSPSLNNTSSAVSSSVCVPSSIFTLSPLIVVFLPSLFDSKLDPSTLTNVSPAVEIIVEPVIFVLLFNVRSDELLVFISTVPLVVKLLSI